MSHTVFKGWKLLIAKKYLDLLGFLICMYDCVCALSISLCACMCLLAFESRKSLTTNAVFQKKSTCNLPTKAHDGSASTQMQSKKKSRSSSRKTRPMKEVNEPAPKQMQKHISQCEKPLKPLYPPSGKSVMVVESVTKAKVIQGYLGDVFEVLPSYGHVRDLAARSGSVRPDDDFSMVWEVPSAAWTHLKSIKVALSGYVFMSLPSICNEIPVIIGSYVLSNLQNRNTMLH